jgi:carbon starvation protein
MIAVVVLMAMAALAAGYFFYGRFLARTFALDNSRPTPAVEINDGQDFVAAKPMLLLGQHFSAISAAGPIVGPILAGLWFGWLPALLWIIIGSIFIGGVHDFASLTASLRHKAASIGQIVKENMSATSRLLFLVFVWLCLVYVIVAFTDITAHTFKTVAADTAYGPGVAASSLLYLLTAVVMGVLLYRFKTNLMVTTLVFVPMVLLIVWLGPHLPTGFLTALGGVSVKQWDTLLLVYCGVASVIPVWVLLQPRGYLGGWLLYLVIAVGLAGALLGGYAIQYPAVHVADFKSLLNGKLIFPILFITVACGACSGFHGIVSSGTTSRQLAKETDAKPVAYGAMLLEALVAVLALATVMMLPIGSETLKGDPNSIYANGIATYLGRMGVGFSLAFPFALLAFSTFVYDTLDVCTRLARYIVQELTGLSGRMGGIVATLATLALPLVVLLLAKEKAYLVAWPIFGTSNQLLASLILLAVSLWLIKSGKPAWFTIAPMVFMLAVTLWSLVLQIIPFVKQIAGNAGSIKPDVAVSGVFGVVLLVLAVWLVAETVRVLAMKKRG